MRLNVKFYEENETIKFTSVGDKDSFSVGFGNVETLTTTIDDYNNLPNKPMINSVVLKGSLTAEDLGLGRVYYDTSDGWDVQSNLVTEAGAIYIYSDYYTIEDEVGNRIALAGIKIGDGSSYLIDAPFVSDYTTSMIIQHITDQSNHVSAADRVFWNNKVSAYADRTNAENLVLSKTSYELNGEIIEYQ